MNDYNAQPQRRRRTEPAPTGRSETRGRDPQPRRRTRATESQPTAAARKASSRRGPRTPQPPKRGGRTPGADDSPKRRWPLIALGILAGLLVLGIIVAGFMYAAIVKQLPDINGAAKGRDQTTIIYDRNKQILTKLFADQNRTDVALKAMPANLRNAIIATEDERFYQHKGVDPLGIARAVLTDVRRGSAAQGGSTITQQYVKQAFVTPDKTLKRKVSEAVLAYRIEKRLSKDRILELYLNTIYFGHGAYGVETAAQTYFGTHATKLTLAQCAMLAGVVKSPGRYSPILNPAAAKQRRDTVLMQMEQQGLITAAQKAKAQAEPVKLTKRVAKVGVAPYFVEYVKAQLVEKYGADAVYRGGLRVQTTIDLNLQRAAEKAIASKLNRDNDPSAALVAMDPKTGAILALVGGRDFSTQQFDAATQGHRQPGSVFKPFVLATAIDNDISVETTFNPAAAQLDIPGEKPWRVSGASARPSGMRLREATEKSVNAVFARLILEVGADKVAATAKALGIRTKITPVPAIALGGLKEGVTPLEMTNAYGTLANGGVRVAPLSIVTVDDSTGKHLFTAPATKGTRAIPAPVAYLTTNVLKGVISQGTGTAAKIGRPAAGKTGTTQEYRDAWFVGYTPALVAGVWVGHIESQQAMNSVHGRRMTGGSFPAEIWASFMREASKGTPASDFARPKGLSNVKVCRETGMQATKYCPQTLGTLVLAGQTLLPCTVHAAPTSIKIPKLIGMAKEDALAALKKLMLLFKVVERNMNDVPAGIVASQTPAAGSVGTTRTVVTIVVSKGEDRSMTPPTASFTVSPGQVKSGTPVAFDASASKATTGKIVTWVWEFGDGQGGNGATVTHTYSAAGSFEVTLWVTNEAGAVGSTTQTIIVK